METIQNSTETSEKLWLHIRNILEDGKLTQDMDESEITALGELFASEETQAYSQTKELLKESLLASLKRGISIQGQAQKDFLQKVITLSGLDFDINAIYEANWNLLSTEAEFGYRYEGYDNGWYSSEPSAYEISPAKTPEEQNYIVKYDPNQNGALIVYKYDDGTGIFNMEEADMLGYITAGSTVIQRESGKDDVLWDNHRISIAGAYTKDGKEKILADTLREDALREQALEAQKLAQQEALRAQRAEAELLTQKSLFETELTTLQSEILLLHAQLKDLKWKNGNQNETIVWLQERIKTLEIEIGELQKTLSLSSTLEQTETLHPDIEEIKNELKACKAEILKLQTQKPALSFEQIEWNNNFELPYQIGKEAWEDTPVWAPVAQEEIAKDGTHNGETAAETFKLSNPTEFWEIGNEHLSNISMESKSDILSLLKKYEGQSFPKTHFEASEYTYAFQCAISLLDQNNSMGNIDGYWGKNSSKALQKVQQEILGFTGNDADGKPGPKTLSRLLEKISQK